MIDYWYEVDLKGGAGVSADVRRGRHLPCRPGKPLVGRAAIEQFYSWRQDRGARTSRHRHHQFPRRIRGRDACDHLLRDDAATPPMASRSCRRPADHHRRPHRPVREMRRRQVALCRAQFRAAVHGRRGADRAAGVDRRNFNTRRSRRDGRRCSGNHRSARYYEEAPQLAGKGFARWITRGANFAIVCSVGRSRRQLSGTAKDEQFVYALEGGVARRRRARERETLGGRGSRHPAAGRLDACISSGPGQVVQLITADEALARQAANAARYADGAPEVAPVEPWPEPVGAIACAAIRRSKPMRAAAWCMPSARAS